LGCHLTTLFGNAAATASTTVIPAVPVRVKKHNMLPVLVVLFLISYGLMTMLIIEQGRTIESQRTLIHELYHDSAELAAVRSRTLQDSAVVDAQPQVATQAQAAQILSSQTPSKQARTPSTQEQAPNTRTPSAQIPLAQTPSAQTPSAQVQSSKTPSTQAPLTQVEPRGRVKNRGAKMAEPQFQAPSRPSADLADERRALRTI
jgi:cytoskeletal protein RodZ